MSDKQKPNLQFSAFPYFDTLLKLYKKTALYILPDITDITTVFVFD